VLARAREEHERNKQHFSSALEIRKYTPVSEFYNSVPGVSPALAEQLWQHHNWRSDTDYQEPYPGLPSEPVQQVTTKPGAPEITAKEYKKLYLQPRDKPLTKKQYNARKGFEP